MKSTIWIAIFLSAMVPAYGQMPESKPALIDNSGSKNTPDLMPQSAVTVTVESDALAYACEKLNLWTKEEAEKDFGQPYAQRKVTRKPDTWDIYKYQSPAAEYADIELSFNRTSQKLTSAYFHPKGTVTWQSIQARFGSHYTKQEVDGTALYTDQNLPCTIGVYVDLQGNVTNLAVWDTKSDERTPVVTEKQTETEVHTPAQTPVRKPTDVLANGDVIEMVQAGLSPDIVLAKIKASNCDFDTSPDALKQLKTTGLPDAVILAMVQAPKTKPVADSTPQRERPKIITYPNTVLAKGNATFQIEVVGTDAWQRDVAIQHAATSGTSNTNCNTNGSANATTYGNITNGTVNAMTNCSTTSTPGTPAYATHYAIQQESVHAILNGQRVTLWCQAGFRKCAGLSPGLYTAEADGDEAVRIYAYSLTTHKLVGKVKFRLVGSW